MPFHIIRHPDDPAAASYVWACDTCNQHDTVEAEFVHHNRHVVVKASPAGVPKRFPCPGDPQHFDQCPGTSGAAHKVARYIWPTQLKCNCSGNWEPPNPATDDDSPNY